MKRTIGVVVALALLLGGMGQARADFYDFTYSGFYGTAGSGTLVTTSSGFSDGSVWAISGSLTLTGIADGYTIPVTYSLLSAGPEATYTPDNGFQLDNLVYPMDNAAGGATASPPPPTYYLPITDPSYLSYGGLYFGVAGGVQINIWGYGNSGYEFEEYIPGYGYASDDFGSFTLTSVPEPSGLVLLGLGIVCLAAGYVARRRQLALGAA